MFAGTLVLFYLFSNRFIVDGAVRSWEYPIEAKSILDSAYDAAIVLGGRVVTYDKATDRLIFRENADKILQTIDLFVNGRVRYIMLSGGPGDLFIHNEYEASYMKKYLLSIGIPDSVILVDSLSKNTHENALNSAKILEDRIPGGKFLLVTTALHMPRAEGCFTKVGLNVTPYVTNKLTGKRRTDIEHLMVPQIESFHCWKSLIRSGEIKLTCFGKCVCNNAWNHKYEDRK